MFQKSLLGGLLVGFFVFFLFVPVFQVKAVVGATCAFNSSTCAPYSCSGAAPAVGATPAKDGRCTGPCDFDTATTCDTVKTGLEWGGAKCSGTADNPATPVDESLGVCLELPGSTQRLADTAPATSGAGLLVLADTLSNWFFAIFTVLAIIFILLAAFEFISAGGDAEKVGDARQKLIWAAIGIMVALASKGLVPIVRSIVGG